MNKVRKLACTSFRRVTQVFLVRRSICEPLTSTWLEGGGERVLSLERGGRRGFEGFASMQHRGQRERERERGREGEREREREREL